MDDKHSAVSPCDQIDEAMMLRCVELSRLAGDKGELPFATVIALDGEVVAEAINRTVRDNDVSRHAEIIALARARQSLHNKDLRRCTVYSNVEPCAMCSYCIRESRIGRVIYALSSPMMGGASKWNILSDETLSARMPQIFGEVPELVSGLLSEQAWGAWRDWNKVIQFFIEHRGFLTAHPRAPTHAFSRARLMFVLWRFLDDALARRRRKAIVASPLDRWDL